MDASTLISIVSFALAAFFALQALRSALSQRQLKGTNLSDLWPPRYFLADLRHETKSVSDTAQVPRVITVRPEALPTSKVAMPPNPPAPPPDAETTSRVPREILRPPDTPLDRTSQFARPMPPSDPE
ncbi:MAG: hypothetical protein J7551_01285 [Chloroflexi bacterium]|jgi:hypothetical protein|nr:hypothetical protein [Chloroflexota bacterium]